MFEVAFLTDAPRIAGSENWLLAYLPQMKQHGIKPTVYITARSALDEYATHLDKAGVAVQRYYNLESIALDMNKANLRVIQAWNASTYAWSFSHLVRPNVSIVHDQLEYFYPCGLRHLYRLGYQISKARFLRQADAIITVSEWGTQFLKNLRLKKVLTIRNGVDVRRFTPRHELRSELRKNFGFNRFTVLVPGRMSPEKNPLTSLLTARLCPDLDFVFVGDDDSYTGRLVKFFAKRMRIGNCRFWGRRWDMPEIYSAADAVLQPTLAENQSLVTIEAMASGLVVVASPIPAQAELISHKVNGLLVTPKPSKLAGALNFLAHNHDCLLKLGTAARRYVLEKHTLEQSALELARTLLYFR